ncbi:MAG TPA: sulfotransferase [Streptosporangiaceae bacterium]|nr:sulfotransferase [Streptosporangiaceae bacterium]
MSDAAAELREQLLAPDPAGRDLALLRTRAYRFSDDVRWYVLTESLEEQYLTGRPPGPSAMNTVRACLAAIRHDGSLPPFPDHIPTEENIDIEACLYERAPDRWNCYTDGMSPAAIVVIVGAPRSGTSHLHNLLAATGRYAYFTTASCWAWPVRNLRQPLRRLFTTLDERTVLTVDNKNTRIIPGLVMPGEAEDIWHRAVPVYRQVRGHRYKISQHPQAGNPGILHAAASAHMAQFGRDTLLVKSPFCSFRIPQLEQIWGAKVSYIHVRRDQRGAADSIRRNRFEFSANGRQLKPEEAWELFTGAVEATAAPGRTVTIHHADLLHDPDGVLGALTRQLA